MKKFFSKSAIVLLALIMCVSVCLFSGCGNEKPNENTDVNKEIKTYSIAVEKGTELGDVTAEPKKTDSQGTLYEISVKPNVGYAVKSFKINGTEQPLNDNKIECILNTDISVSVEYQRKTSEELTKRQDTILAKMEQYVGTFFKYDQDYTYVLNGRTIVLKKGVLYGGLPYTQYAATSPDAYLDFAISKDSNNVYTMSFPTGNSPFYWGGSCGNAAFWAWASVSSTIKFTYSADMVEKFGVYPVGIFSFDPETDIVNGTWQDTKTVCDANGIEVMAEAYAMLCRADAITYRSKLTDGHVSGNHVVIVTGVNTVRRNNGTIMPDASYITYQDQNGGYGQKSGANGKTVESSCAYNGKMTFLEMFINGYLPVTCIELLDDSAPLAKAEVTDSLKAGEYNARNVTRGYIDSNYAISKAVMEITDANGNSVYKATRHGSGETPTRLAFSRFASNDGDHSQTNVYNDALDLKTLAAGEYKCVVTAYLSNGETTVVRDFGFTN